MVASARNKLQKKRALSEREKRRRFWIVGGVFAWFICLSGVFGNSGFIQAYKVSLLKRDMGFRLQALENEKSRLETTYQALSRESFVQEQTVREVLGFVREDELVFEFEE